MHSLASKIDNPLIWNVTSEPGVNSIFVMLKLYQLRHEVNIPHIWILCPVGILLPFPLKFSEIKLDYFDLPCLDLEFYAQWKLGPNMKLYITYVYIVNCTMHIGLYTLHYMHYIHQTMNIAVCTLHHAHCTMPIALCTLHIAKYTLHYAHCTTHIVLWHCTLQIALCILLILLLMLLLLFLLMVLLLMLLLWPCLILRITSYFVEVNKC